MEYCDNNFQCVCVDPSFMGMEEKSFRSSAAALGSLLQRTEHPAPNVGALQTPGTILAALGSLQYLGIDPSFQTILTTDPTLLQRGEHPAPNVEALQTPGTTSAALDSLQHLGIDPSFHTVLTTDPTLLHMNEHRSVNIAKLHQFGAIATPAVRVADSVHQSPQAVSYQTHPFSTDVINRTTLARNSPFPCDGEAASDSQCVKLYSFSSDSTPQIMSDSSTQEACMYSSLSKCLNEADSSCSSEQEGLLSTPCLAGFSSDEISWQDADALQGNFGDSIPGMNTVETKQPDDPSAAASDIDDQQSSTYAFGSLVGQLGTVTECASLLPPSPTSPDLSDVWSGSMISGAVNQEMLTLNPALASVNGLFRSSNLPDKRQKVCYRMDSIPPENWSRPKLSSFSQNNSRSNFAKAGAAFNINDALYNDVHVSTKRIPYMP